MNVYLPNPPTALANIHSGVAVLMVSICWFFVPSNVCGGLCLPLFGNAILGVDFNFFQ